MRLIAFVLAALVISGPASAEWKEFNSVSEGFGVVFPADPDVEEVAMFEVVPGKMMPARIYSARYDNSLFKMTVVDGRDAGLPEAPVIDQALNRLTQGGELKINVPHRIYFSDRWPDRTLGPNSRRRGGGCAPGALRTSLNRDDNARAPRRPPILPHRFQAHSGSQWLRHLDLDAPD